MGDLTSPTHPRPAQNNVPSSPSDSDSSVFESEDHHDDEKRPLKVPDSSACDSVHLPIIEEVAC